MNPQIRANALRVLTFLKEKPVHESVMRHVEDCMAALELKPHDFELAMKFLLRQKYIIPDRSILSRVERRGVLELYANRPGLFVVNQNKPDDLAGVAQQPKPPARRRPPRVPKPSAPKEEAAQPTAHVAEPLAPTAGVPRLQPVDIEPAIHLYLTRAVEALRACSKFKNAWLALGVVDCEAIVERSMPELTRSQIVQLVRALRKGGILRTCKAKISDKTTGCSHVKAAPGSISPAMARKLGFKVEPTIDELREALQAAQRHNAELLTQLGRHRVNLPEALAAEVQYFILRALPS